jgi:hypothetical protein
MRISLYNKETNTKFPISGMFIFAGGVSQVSGDGRRADKTLHPDKYTNGSGLYDIALISVAVPFDFSLEIGKIPLAPKGYVLPIGTLCNISGFGYSR